MLWIVLIIVIFLFFLFRLFIGLMGNWRATLNSVITQYIAWKQTESKYSDKQIFMSVLDGRYQQPNKDVEGLLSQMNQRKNQIKQEIEVEIEGGVSVLNKYNLPILIYACLLIEQNNYLNKRKSIEELLDPITSEVKRQGFSKYC